ncbi:MAG: HAD-IIIA family hydrolase [bacterium]|nr:HAD-IIIA family hydrolase [bacterium]
MNKAIFLDRDGLINEMQYNEERKEFEPAYIKDDLRIYDGVIETLRDFQDNGYKLFIVSNQPDYAKGKTSMESLKEVHDELHRIFSENGISFTKYYYCYHHPDGIVPEYSIECECRKPGNLFVREAIEKYDIDKESSWFVGDRDKDVECGVRSGLKTIRVKSNYYNYTNKTDADFVVDSLQQASEKILSKQKN